VFAELNMYINLHRIFKHQDPLRPKIGLLLLFRHVILNEISMIQGNDHRDDRAVVSSFVFSATFAAEFAGVKTPTRCDVIRGVRGGVPRAPLWLTGGNMAVRRLPFALCRPRYASCCTRICAFMQSQTVRPSTLVHPSARPSVRLSSPIIALARCTRGCCIFSFAQQFARQSSGVSIPRGTSRLQRYIRAGWNTSEPAWYWNTTEHYRNTIDCYGNNDKRKGTDPAGGAIKKKEEKQNCALSHENGAAQVK